MIPASFCNLTFYDQHFLEEMYSFKTLIQALLVASIATFSLAVVLPDRDVIHAERALLLGPGLAEGLERIGPAGLKALVNTDIKKTFTGVQQVIKNVTYVSLSFLYLIYSLATVDRQTPAQ